MGCSWNFTSKPVMHDHSQTQSNLADVQVSQRAIDSQDRQVKQRHHLCKANPKRQGMNIRHTRAGKAGLPMARMQWCRRPGPSLPWAISKPLPSPRSMLLAGTFTSCTNFMTVTILTMAIGSVTQFKADARNVLFGGVKDQCPVRYLLSTAVRKMLRVTPAWTHGAYAQTTHSAMISDVGLTPGPLRLLQKNFHLDISK